IVPSVVHALKTEGSQVLTGVVVVELTLELIHPQGVVVDSDLRTIVVVEVYHMIAHDIVEAYH
ncbi:hypothetical protein DCD76_18885, partial [Acinetobacter baumannii]